MPRPKTAEHNTATIHVGKQIIRTYSEEEHGETFLELANEFANKDKKYEIKLTYVKPNGIVCPGCGREFHL